VNVTRTFGGMRSPKLKLRFACASQVWAHFLDQRPGLPVAIKESDAQFLAGLPLLPQARASSLRVAGGERRTTVAAPRGSVALTGDIRVHARIVDPHAVLPCLVVLIPSRSSSRRIGSTSKP